MIWLPYVVVITKDRKKIKEELPKNTSNLTLVLVGDTIIGDLNGYMGKTYVEYKWVHGGYGYGDRNENDGMILDFSTSYDLIIVNIHFKKRDEDLVTYKSGHRLTIIAK